ncbi:MAG: hypothetical protein HZA93_07555 [Verrucomicrobia bacterium]|nr:hypothetical protein [Verrucomicrobiota bacterium]
MKLAARLALLAAGAASVLSAQSTAPAAAAPRSDGAALTAADSATAPTTTRRNRAISAEAAAALAAAAPKYAPPPPPPPKKVEEELPDLRETDKPKNNIIRLPKYVVQDRKPPVFTERDLHTEKGLAAIAMNRYLSETDRALNRFRIPFISMSSEQRALMMYAEDERLRKMDDFADRANMVQKSDAASGLYIKREVDKTFLRTNDFGWQGGGPNGRP